MTPLRPLPHPPDDREKTSYVRRRLGPFTAMAALAFGCLCWSQWTFFQADPRLWVFLPFLLLSSAGYLGSLALDLFTRDFDLAEHERLVAARRPADHPSVDVFLPVCGEPLDLLRNTWIHVRELVAAYPGRAVPFVLDDAADAEVAGLALEFGFRYGSRPNRGWYRKAGNLRFGFDHSAGDFVLVLDADFAPRPDMLDELLPYFDTDPRVGIVQSPQYFRVLEEQNWLERGAGAVQEVFYRSIQMSRWRRGGGTVCCGSCAVYRRTALAEIDGSSLVEHSEDMHTGFELRSRGWRIRYVPLVLSAGICPDETGAFLAQQHRWSSASLAMVTGRAFWRAKVPFGTRLSYVSGFLHYLHTALFVLWAPFIPLVLLYGLPHVLSAEAALWLVPGLAFAGLVLPRWHRCQFRLEAWAVRLMCCWAHLFALWDLLRRRPPSWMPSGVRGGRDVVGPAAWNAAAWWSFLTAALWVGLAFWRLTTMERASVAVMLVAGLFDLLVAGRVLAQPEKTA